MQMLLDIFALSFMQRALIGGILLALLLALLGVLATLKKMAFFSEGVAHASLAGIALAIFASLSPLPVAIVWAITIAVLIFWLERYTKLPSDTVIGILFTASMAFGVIIMSLTSGYQPELISFLFGSILAITWTDIIIMSIVSAGILVWFFLSLRQLTFLSLSEETARVHGINVDVQNLLFYVALSISTVLGVKILGIVLVSAFIVIPAATARLVSHSFKEYLITSVIFAEIAVISGLILSFVFDLPSGAVVVLSGTMLFLLAFASKYLTLGHR